MSILIEQFLPRVALETPYLIVYNIIRRGRHFALVINDNSFINYEQ